MALLVFPGVFLLTVKGSYHLADKKIPFKKLALQLAYIFIPIGIFAWIAFSIPPVAVNYNYILSVLSDPFGWGWNLFGTADYPFAPFYPEWLPIIQGILLLTGLYLGISRGFLGLKRVIPDPAMRVKTMILPSLFVLFIVNIFLKLYMG